MLGFLFCNKMKQLFIVRHAKTEWAGSGKSDFSRSLTPSGIHEAKVMAEKLAEENIKIDILLCSSAFRAKETASFFAASILLDKKMVSYIDELYLAPSQMLSQTIEKLDNNFNQVMIIAHNPGITDWVNSMTEQIKIDEMPTCGVFAVSSDVIDWKDFENSKKHFLFFDYPKPHHNIFSK